MLYREIIAVCSQIHTKPINALCGQNVELVSTLFHGIGDICRLCDSSSRLALACSVLLLRCVPHSPSYSPSMTGLVVLEGLDQCTDDGLTLKTTPLFIQPDNIGS
jgi:hypothetical protein